MARTKTRPAAGIRPNSIAGNGADGGASGTGIWAGNGAGSGATDMASGGADSGAAPSANGRPMREPMRVARHRPMRGAISAIAKILCIALLVSITAYSAPASHAAEAGTAQAADAQYFADLDAMLQRWNLYGYLNGYPDRKFSMGESATRGQIAYFVMNFAAIDPGGPATAQGAASQPGSPGSSPAPDMPAVPGITAGAWYKDGMQYLIGKGFMPLADGDAAPDEPLSRQDAAYLLFSAFALDAESAAAGGYAAAPEFADARAIDADKRVAAMLATSLGLIEPINGKYFLPKAPIAFHELLAALDKLLDTLGKHPDIGATYKNRDAPGYATVRFYDDLAAALGDGARIRFQDASLKEVYYKARTIARNYVPRDASAQEKAA
ncbi:MAG: hypothetical protein LBJ10_06485, partial [Clostridiales bacterium]|nr:hypothetical protein [Clostridiales bacterium]